MMAPRGRQRKVGLKRIDAAIDALVPLGFSKEVVSMTINNLLKVYDGDAGWVFIEEASYKLVIETILEQQEKEKLTDEEEGEAIDVLRALEISEQVVEAGETSTHREVIADKVHSGQCEQTSGMVERSQRSLSSGVVDPVSILQKPNEPAKRRRPPCRGWISESEDDDDDDDDDLHE